MTLHTSHCRRALHRQLRSPGDSIWISDQLLTAAFDRYCRISTAGQRNVGHVPGPLEAQRRLGKRRMGDMYFQQASSAPSWAFSVPLNLSQWQWEAPKLASELRDGFKTPPLTRVIRWLETVAYPELNDPNEIVLDPTTVLAARGQATLRSELDAFLAIPQNESLSILELAARDFFAKFEDAIRLASIPLESILPTFQETWRALDRIYAGRARGQELYADLCSSLVAGISASRVLESGDFHAAFWATVVAKITELGYREPLCGPLNQIMSQLSKLPFDSTVADVWLQIMNYIPAESILAVSDGVLSMLDAAFLSWSLASSKFPFFHEYMSPLFDPACSQNFRIKTKGKKKAVIALHQEALSQRNVVIKQIQIVASAMRHVNTKAHIKLLDMANQRASQIATKMGALRILRSNWACVLAQMPGVCQHQLFRYIARLAKSRHRVTVFSDLELCSLLLLHWESRGYLQRFKGRIHETNFRGQIRGTYNDWLDRMGGGNAAFMCLAVAVWWKTPYECHTSLLSSIGVLLKKLDRLDHLFGSIERGYGGPRKLPSRFLQQVARTMNDPRIAIKLHHLFANAKLTSPDGSAGSWDPSVFRFYVSDIIQDKTIPPGKLWEVLDIEMYQGPRRTRRTPEQMRRLKTQHLGIYGAKRAEIVVAAASEYANATHLTNRVALRHVEQCIHFLERSCDVLPMSAVEALYKVVSRDLVEGKRARYTRLRWLIDVVRRNYGPEVADRTRAALRKWRAGVRAMESLKDATRKQAELEAQPKMVSLPGSRARDQIKAADPIAEALKTAFQFK